MTDFQQQLAFHTYTTKGYDYLPLVVLGFTLCIGIMLYKIVKQQESK